ncbi:MAG: hypothetical protein IT158_00120 [Bryobacterales bacterium]|nr:hypothetical protein [Bryobacterales bacterium]
MDGSCQRSAVGVQLLDPRTRHAFHFDGTPGQPGVADAAAKSLLGNRTHAETLIAEADR